MSIPRVTPTAVARNDAPVGRRLLGSTYVREARSAPVNIKPRSRVDTTSLASRSSTSGQPGKYAALPHTLPRRWGRRGAAGGFCASQPTERSPPTDAQMLVVSASVVAGMVGGSKGEGMVVGSKSSQGVRGLPVMIRSACRRAAMGSRESITSAAGTQRSVVASQVSRFARHRPHRRVAQSLPVKPAWHWRESGSGRRDGGYDEGG